MERFAAYATYLSARAAPTARRPEICPCGQEPTRLPSKSLRNVSLQTRKFESPQPAQPPSPI
ncbi:unnamed protein product [Ectocarpus sp. CCAP 1310/34]|nr:unnamed protein product [Ectocarpus sp. CCAP 1310/34]